MSIYPSSIRCLRDSWLIHPSWYHNHLDSFTKNAIKTLNSKKGKVILVVYGTFSKAKRAARKSRNPQIGKDVYVRLKRLPFFKVGIELKEMINSLY